MDFAFNEEQDLLRETARRFLAERAPSERVRQAMDTDAGYDEDLWAEIGAQGWQAMAIPETYGGAGYSFLDQVVLMEEMGRALLPVPYLASVILAANVLLLAGSDEQKESYLPGIASGEQIWTVALTEASGRWDATGIETRGAVEGDTITISGTKRFVLDGHIADHLIVAVRTGPASDPSAGISLVIVPAGLEGIERRKLDAMDQTRTLADVVFNGARVPSANVIGTQGGAWPAIAHVLDLAGVALAAEQVGGAQKCLEMAVEYAKVRTQFGRPIGSFQAIKHKCADMLVQVESAKSAAYYAGWATSEQNEEFPLVAPLAKSYCSEAYFFCAAENIQIHGGIGFTWEHDAHLYFKRAKSSELLFGDPAYHRSRLGDRLGL
ncbi:MAG: acyl-CoA/acyl-ACP dehydrogenase [Acidimicrobiia bacterium]|nr:acyl-CoA/acyl-ACP dehydrogenase [Acidimicrobiia bacterium]